jgi:hypothetical protein
LAAVKLPHDLSAVVAQFTLGDLSSHKPNVARRATQAFILPQGTECRRRSRVSEKIRS